MSRLATIPVTARAPMKNFCAGGLLQNFVLLFFAPSNLSATLHGGSLGTAQQLRGLLDKKYSSKDSLEMENRAAFGPPPFFGPRKFPR